MSDGFKSQTLRDQIQPREHSRSSWQKAWIAQQKKDVDVCPQRNEDWVCTWSVKYRKVGVECHGRYYRDGCSVWKMVEANGGDPAVLIQ